ncbi:hypothetical protein EYC80_008266 [Monilinia laxa]|nr:hypothetical protein EYC80_008266 [Monilinia laxa]
MLGASAVWVGTRFILTDEAGASKAHQEAVRTAGHDDNIRTIIFTGRPLRIKELTSKGVIPVEHDFETLGDDIDDETMDNARPFLMGKAAAVVNEKKSAKAVVDELVSDAVACIHKGEKLTAKLIDSEIVKLIVHEQLVSSHQALACKERHSSFKMLTRILNRTGYGSFDIFSSYTINDNDNINIITFY